MEKLYTTRMRDKRHVEDTCYLIEHKKGEFKYESARFKKPTEYFIKGEGWKKINAKTKIELIEVPKYTTYAEINAGVQKWGAELVAKFLGFCTDSYGDRYPISELMYFKHYGEEYVEWLERIAAIDAKIYRWFETELKCSFTGSIYDVWIKQGEGDDAKFECSFRKNPFLGFHLESLLMGIVLSKHPSIDIIRWDDTFQQIIHQFHPEFLIRLNTPSEEEMTKREKYHLISCAGWIEIMCGKEDREWLTNNLTFKPTILENSEEEVSKT